MIMLMLNIKVKDFFILGDLKERERLKSKANIKGALDISGEG
jgi:hypothetical protein